jgi:hypothetical protein
LKSGGEAGGGRYPDSGVVKWEPNDGPASSSLVYVVGREGDDVSSHWICQVQCWEMFRDTERSISCSQKQVIVSVHMDLFPRQILVREER